MVKKHQCTLKDVAQAVGVAAYTVSRALNGKKDISDEMREKILKTAEEMGYVPNVAARGLQSGRTRTIAVVFDDFQNPYYNMLLTKLAYTLHTAGYHLTIFFEFNSISELSSELMQRVLSSNPDGIISFIHVDKKAIELNRIWRRPLVVLGVEQDAEEADSMFFDDVKGGRLVAEYLMREGCKKIGFVNATSRLTSGLHRMEGYTQAIESRGGSCEGLTVQLEDSGMTVEQAFDFLVREKGADGLFCFNDVTALSALWYLSEHNPGRRVRVVGWDHIQQSMNLPVRLSTVHVHTDAVVEEAVRLLIGRIEGADAPVCHKMFDIAIVEGDT